MASPLLFGMVTFYVGLVILRARRSAAQTETDAAARLRQAEDIFHQLGDKKKELRQEKINLQNEAMEIFTLYEITKDITNSLSEDEAVAIFKDKLREHVVFKECRFLDALSPEVKGLRADEGYFVFTPRSKKVKLGYLAVEGVSEVDREKVMILGHQFALALRRVRLYREIERVAITDSLTRTRTRRHILERFQEELTRSKARDSRMSFLMVDVDYFKKYNDQYGHLTGDQILKEVAALISENIREIDIAGRYGGEEFCVVLPDTGREGARFAAERIRLAAERAAIKAYDTAVKVTVSVGTATSPDDGKKMEELIDKADWALYRAKKQGRNRVCSFGVYEGK
jgi:diguanylate cyclase (GGDEF)-like protein